MYPFTDPAVEARFDAFSSEHQSHLRQLRTVILDTAQRAELPCDVEETLKWGQPSYLPVKARVGSAVRLGGFDTDHVALYFNCQTRLVERLRDLFRDELTYSKNRALLFPVNEPLPEGPVGIATRMALRYYLDP